MDSSPRPYLSCVQVERAPFPIPTGPLVAKCPPTEPYVSSIRRRGPQNNDDNSSGLGGGSSSSSSSMMSGAASGSGSSSSLVGGASSSSGAADTADGKDQGFCAVLLAWLLTPH